MYLRLFRIIALIILCTANASAQNFTISGLIIDNNNLPIEFATIVLPNSNQWAVSDQTGKFTINNVAKGQTVVAIQCLGFVKKQITIDIAKNIDNLTINLNEDNLKIKEVVVTARKADDIPSTAYTFDRNTIDHNQIINIGDIQTLLPGGKTEGNPTLINNNRVALHSNTTSELGNASFSTAIEVDGVRIGNNAAMDETAGASTRNISSSNIESIEIITGIPSVEYGDLGNGIVKVNTKKGKTPTTIDLSTSQHTKQVAISKGFELGHNIGTLNTSFEHTKSMQDPVSPYTSYQRNVVDLKYCNTFNKQTSPIMFTATASANIGGYNSEADPDAFSNNYKKVKDHNIRASAKIDWLLNKNWITNFNASISVSASNKTSETNTATNASSPAPYIHATTEGYYIATEYDPQNQDAPIILGPTGYWEVLKYTESKPIDIAAKLKYQLSKKWSDLSNKIMVGADYSTNANSGRGTYYDNMQYAPTWREYSYKELPMLNNIAIYAEDKADKQLDYAKGAAIQLIAGLREDITLLANSNYNNVYSLSPRVNAKYIVWKNKNLAVEELNFHIGYGKSVKLPSFQVLYPYPEYFDIPVFASQSTTDNISFLAYYTHPFSSATNSNLKWQYTNQTELGTEINILGTRISITAYYNKTYRPYSASNIYSTFTYYRTLSTELQNCLIESSNRIYYIDQHSGQITVVDATNSNNSTVLNTTPTNTYKSNTTYINANPITRYGIDWAIDFPQIKPIKTIIRLDGNYYHYKGYNSTLYPYWANSSSNDSNNQPYNYIGYYSGTYSTFNGSIKQQLNQNATFTTHIPKIRLIVSLKIEATLYQYSKSIADGANYGIAYATDEGQTTGIQYNSSMKDVYLTVYPIYYSTWDNPNNLIPFAETYLWAKENDPNLYADLGKMIVSTNYNYMVNPDKISAYFSANINITKEIGKVASISFYANNFFFNNANVKSSKTGLKTTLSDTGYIPTFYYGTTLRIKF